MLVTTQHQLQTPLCGSGTVYLCSRGVLWEEPELAVDSERSSSSGNGEAVDAICPIAFVSFGQRRVGASRLREQTKTTQGHKVHVFTFDRFFDFGGDGMQSVFLTTQKCFLFKKNVHHLAARAPKISSERQRAALVFTGERQTRTKSSLKSRSRLRLGVFYSCLNSGRLGLLLHSQSRQAVRVVIHRLVWNACASRPTQTHLMAGWLAFLPHSVIMALLQASRLCCPCSDRARASLRLGHKLFHLDY